MIERIPEAKRGKFDIVDMIEAGTEPEAIRAAAEAACEPVAMSAAETARTRVGGILTDAEIDAEIERLSKLPLVAYERQRGAAARRVDMRATILDKLVRASDSRRPLTDKVSRWTCRRPNLGRTRSTGPRFSPR